MLNLKLKRISVCGNLKVTTIIISTILVVAFNSTHAKSPKSSGSFRASKFKGSKFLTGVIAGSLLFPHRSNSVSYDHSYDVSYDDELFIEYERNNQLLENGALSKDKRAKLERRNQQIKNELIKSAENQYISSYSLKLIPLKQKVIETKERHSKFVPLSNFFKGNSAKDKNLVHVERKKIIYQLTLGNKSPKKIDDFDVLRVNGVKPNQNHPYSFNYLEKWGENVIDVELRDKRDHSLIIGLTTSYYVNDMKETEDKSIWNGELSDWISKMLVVELLLFIPVALFNLLKPSGDD